MGIPDGRADLRWRQHVPSVQLHQQTSVHRHHLLRRRHPSRIHRLRQLHVQLAGQSLQIQDVLRPDDVRGESLLVSLHGRLSPGAGSILRLAGLHGTSLRVCLSRRAAFRVLGVRSALHLLHHRAVRRGRLHHHHDATAGHRHPFVLLSLRPRCNAGGRPRHGRGLPRSLPPRLRAQPDEEVGQTAAANSSAEGLVGHVARMRRHIFVVAFSFASELCGFVFCKVQ